MAGFEENGQFCYNLKNICPKQKQK